MIFVAREPRNTRAIGPIEDEPTTSTSPSAHGMSSIASAQSSPTPTAHSASGTTSRAAFRTSSIHWATIESSASRPTPDV